MLRPLVMSIFGWRVVVVLRSTSSASTPWCSSSRGKVSPTGPAPAMRTEPCSTVSIVMGTSPTVVALVTERRLQGSEALQCVVKQRNRFGHADLRHGGGHGPQQGMHLLFGQVHGHACLGA